MSKKVPLFTLASVVALSLITSACGSSSGTSSNSPLASTQTSNSPSADVGQSASASPEAGGTLISLGSYVGAGLADEAIKAKEALNQKNDRPDAVATFAVNYTKIVNEALKKQNITLKYEDWGWSEPLIQKETAAFLAKQGPDVIVGETQSPGFAVQGVLEPFPDWLEKEVRDHIVEAAWKPMEVNGKIYGVAPEPGVNNLYWNKKLFKEAGLDPDKGPATWNEWLEMSKQINDAGKGKFYAGGVYAGPNNGGYLRFGALPLLSGGGFVDADNNPIFNSDKNVAAFELIREMNKYNPKGLMPNNSEGVFWDAFQKDQIAFVVDGPWRVQTCKDLKQDCGMGQLPLPDGGKSGNVTIGASFHSVPVYAKNKEAAWKYIEAIISVDVQKAIADANIRPPVNKLVAETDDYKSKHPELYQVYLAEQGNVQGLPTFNKDNSKAWQIYGEAMVKAMMTDTPIKDILDDAQKKVLQVTQ